MQSGCKTIMSRLPFIADEIAHFQIKTAFAKGCQKEFLFQRSRAEQLGTILKSKIVIGDSSASSWSQRQAQRAVTAFRKYPVE
jgi:hypothetical protein